MMPRIMANILLPSAIVLLVCGSSLFAFHSAPSFRASEKVNNQKYFFAPSSSCVLPNRSLQLSSKEKNENDGSDESARLKRKAEQLREEIRTLEGILQSSDRRRTTPTNVILSTATRKDEEESCSLRGKTVLVVGANGRLGSMVCRYLLRNNPKTQVVAAVHYVGEATTRGYGRLSYEVGAEDGKGFISAAWNTNARERGMDDRGDQGGNDTNAAYFQYTDEMKGYNLHNLRVVDVELLDPVQCMTITENVDCVIWCATDFDGNIPRSIAAPLNLAFLFRAVSKPTKGRVEIEGLTNILAGLKNSQQSRRWMQRKSLESSTTGETGLSSSTGNSNLPEPARNNDPISLVLVSASESAFDDFETPFGSFKGLKRDGERIATQDFPSLSTCVLRMSRYDDTFVEEDLDILREEEEVGEKSTREETVEEQSNARMTTKRRRINRRDAARAAVDTLTDPLCKGKIFNVWTVT